MAHFTFTDLRDKVLVWLTGRRLGILGDNYGSDTAVLSLDGVAIGSTRSGPTALMVSAAGVAAAGPVTVAGAVVGDNVAFVLGPTNADAGASFETTVSVAGQVQQTSASNLSANQYVFFLQPQS